MMCLRILLLLAAVFVFTIRSHIAQAYMALAYSLVGHG
jgi:signal peptidase I